MKSSTALFFRRSERDFNSNPRISRLSLSWDVWPTTVLNLSKKPWMMEKSSMKKIWKLSSTSSDHHFTLPHFRQLIRKKDWNLWEKLWLKSKDLSLSSREPINWKKSLKFMETMMMMTFSISSISKILIRTRMMEMIQRLKEWEKMSMMLRTENEEFKQLYNDQ